MEDSYIHKGQRLKLVKGLQKKGIKDEKILSAINSVPRHFFFFDTGLQNHAYIDKAFPIGSGQTISQPYTVAVQSQLLDIQKNDKVLEIGTGSGYQAAILSKLGCKVFSIERQKKLYHKTKCLFDAIGIHSVKMFLGDGFKGLPNYAPFDKIIITAAAPVIPKTLLEQLKTGGYVVIPLDSGETQVMLRIKKISDTEFEKQSFGEFSFVPMLNGLADD